MHLAEALERWREFYLLVGTAGATLLALLFVAATLGVGYLSEGRQTGTRLFMSPVVIHFTSVFFLSAVALVPSHRTVFFAVIIGAAALVGACVSAVVTVRVIRTDLTGYWQDYFAYGLLPALAYLALLIAAVLVVMENDFALDLIGGALLLLTIVNIRNAWDLTLAMARRPHRPEQGG